jgi:CRISPR/Cas system CSM-associated protein Csm3 (group 7 of RAMP superfamily)
VHLRLIPETPILIIDHDASFPKQESDQENELSADHVYLQDNHQAVIPGSTLKGLVKARCRKILLTLLPEHDVDAWLMPAFGDMQKGLGYIRFFDATETQQKAYQHEQIFNAIDRFTGGVKHPALYQVKAIQPEAFETRLSWRKTDNVDQDWFFGLMLLVLRDAMEADLTVGWGKAKGFGCFHLELSLDIKSKRKWINDWSGFAKNYQQHTTIQVCLDAFDNKIQSSLLPAEPVA